MKLSNACNYTTSGSVKDQLYIVQLTTNKQTNKQIESAGKTRK